MAQITLACDSCGKLVASSECTRVEVAWEKSVTGGRAIKFFCDECFPSVREQLVQLGLLTDDESAA